MSPVGQQFASLQASYPELAAMMNGLDLFSIGVAIAAILIVFGKGGSCLVLGAGRGWYLVLRVSYVVLQCYLDYWLGVPRETRSFSLAHLGLGKQHYSFRYILVTPLPFKCSPRCNSGCTDPPPPPSCTL